MHEYLAEYLANEADLQSSLTEKIYELPKISCRKFQKSKKDCKNVLTAYLYRAMILVSKGEIQMTINDLPATAEDVAFMLDWCKRKGIMVYANANGGLHFRTQQ